MKASPLSQTTTVTQDEPAALTKVKSEAESTPPSKQEEESQASSAVDIKGENLAEPKTGDKREFGPSVDSDEKDKTKTNPRKRPKP